MLAILGNKVLLSKQHETVITQHLCYQQEGKVTTQVHTNYIGAHRCTQTSHLDSYRKINGMRKH